MLRNYARVCNPYSGFLAPVNRTSATECAEKALFSGLSRHVLHYGLGIKDGQKIDMYVRMYDELKCKEGDNPTIGILLCSETDQDIARYSVLHDNDRLFMSKYLTYMPTKEQLKHEIEKQKSIFYAQHPELDDKNDESEK
ncbi:MAG: PDDEXK nuclease domain-containing protein [Candidatus Weimeria sp.]